MRLREIYCLNALVLFACVPEEPAYLRHSVLPETEIPAQEDRPPRTRNVILVTLDGVRWQDVFLGPSGGYHGRRASGADLLPNLHRRVIEKGVALGAPGDGEPILGSAPSFVSLPGYLELLGGRRTSCGGNGCGATGEPTLLDELRSQLDVSTDDVAVIASWEKLALAASSEPERITISAGRHGGITRNRLRVNECASRALDEAAGSSAAPGFGDYRRDFYTAHLALEYLVERRPRLLHVALGDTDEHAHRLNYGAYLDALAYADRFVGELLDALSAMGTYGAETTVIVTTDHGRSASFFDHGAHAPESGRVFILAVGGAIPARGIVPARSTRRLRDIGPTIRAFFDLPVDASPRAGLAIPELLPRSEGTRLVGNR